MGTWRSNGIDMIRDAYLKAVPNGEELPAYVMSDSWSKMDLATQALPILQSVEIEKLNGYIPWAFIQHPSQWVGGDPNPTNAFTVGDDASLTVTKGYYYFKQFCRAGQRNMNVVDSRSDQTQIFILAFGKGNNKVDDVSDNFIILSMTSKEMRINIEGSSVEQYDMYRTSDGSSGDDFKYIGRMNTTQIDGTNKRYFMWNTLQGVVTFFGVKS